MLLTAGIGALVCTSLGGATALASDTRAQAYADAAAEFGVPEDLVLAVSYVETRWNTHQGEPSRGAGYGPMHLTDLATAAPETLTEDRRGDAERPRLPRAASLQTVDRAAELLDTSAARVRTDPRQNIRGGTALLADYQQELGQEVSDDPADWYGAVARYSGASDRDSARWYADQVYEVLSDGAENRTDDGHRLSLAPDPVDPERSVLKELGLRETERGAAECPRSLPCEWLPAPYEEFGDGDYGNHDKADRPHSQRIRYIVIHDTEADYDSVLEMVQDPTYVSWQYSMRNRDGQIAQHVKWKDVGWHAGNWYVNSKSVGIEHEGYAARGTWYSEVMYRKSAELVRYIARKNDIPIDRQHIVGHDNVPGIDQQSIEGMHWDPGPYWDWDRYFELLKRPIRPTGTSFSGMLTIKPDFESNNPGFTRCEDQPGPPGETEAPKCGDWGSSAVVLRDAPRHDAALLKDVGSNPPDGKSSMNVADIGSRASTGQQFAVAEIRGDWTAIWFHGQKGWFHNPPSDPNAVWATGLVVTPEKGKKSVPVYGRAYPEPEAYPDNVPVQEIVELGYELNPGERYALGQRPETEYLWATTFDPSGHEVVRGEQRYYQIQVGHRFGYVKADDVVVRPSWELFR